MASSAARVSVPRADASTTRSAGTISRVPSIPSHRTPVMLRRSNDGTRSRTRHRSRITTLRMRQRASSDGVLEQRPRRGVERPCRSRGGERDRNRAALHGGRRRHGWAPPRRRQDRDRAPGRSGKAPPGRPTGDHAAGGTAACPPDAAGDRPARPVPARSPVRNDARAPAAARPLMPAPITTACLPRRQPAAAPIRRGAVAGQVEDEDRMDAVPLCVRCGAGWASSIAGRCHRRPRSLRL